MLSVEPWIENAGPAWLASGDAGGDGVCQRSRIASPYMDALSDPGTSQCWLRILEQQVASSRGHTSACLAEREYAWLRRPDMRSRLLRWVFRVNRAGAVLPVSCVWNEGCD